MSKTTTEDLEIYFHVFKIAVCEARSAADNIKTQRGEEENILLDAQNRYLRAEKDLIRQRALLDDAIISNAGFYVESDLIG